MKVTQPTIVGIFGLVGSGKSTVVAELMKQTKTKAKAISYDDIRLELRKQGKPMDDVYPEGARRVLTALKQYPLVLLDSDAVRTEKRKQMEQLAKKFGASIRYVRVICELDTMISRSMLNKPHTLFTLNHKGRNNAQAGQAAKLREMMRRLPWHYQWSKENGGKWTLKALPVKLEAVIDTTDGKTWKKQVKQFAKKLK